MTTFLETAAHNLRIEIESMSLLAEGGHAKGMGHIDGQCGLSSSKGSQSKDIL